MDFRRRAPICCCVLCIGLWSTASAVAVEDDRIVETAKSQKEPVRLEPDRLVGQFQFVIVDNGEKVAVNRQIIKHAGRIVVVEQEDQLSEFNDERFNDQIFGKGNNPLITKAKWRAELQANIEELDRNCQLTATQKKKLEMIGRGEQKKLLDQVEDLREKCRDGFADHGFRNTQKQIVRTKIVEGMLLGEDSFYQKYLRTILTADQLKKCSVKRKVELQLFADPGQVFK